MLAVKNSRKRRVRVGAGSGDLGRDEGVGFAGRGGDCAMKISVASLSGKKQSHKGRYGMGSEGVLHETADVSHACPQGRWPRRSALP